MVPWTFFFNFVFEKIKQNAISMVAGDFFTTINKAKSVASNVKQAAILAKSPKEIVNVGKTFFQENVSDPLNKVKGFFDKTPQEKSKYLKKKSFQLFERNILKEIPTYSFFRSLYKKMIIFLNERIRQYKRLLRLQKKHHKQRLKTYRLQARILRMELKRLHIEKQFYKKKLRIEREFAKLERKRERAIKRALAERDRIQREYIRDLKKANKEYLEQRKEGFKRAFNVDLSTKTTIQKNDYGELFKIDVYDFHQFEDNFLNFNEKKMVRKWMKVPGVHYSNEDLPKYVQGRQDIGNESNYIRLNTKSVKFKSKWILEASWVPLWVFMEAGKGFNMNYNNTRTRGFMKLKLKRSKRVKSSKNRSLVYVWWNISYGLFQKIVQDPTGENFWKVFFKKNRKNLIYITIDSKYYKRKTFNQQYKYHTERIYD